jgi:hypothetical protein
MRPPAHLPEGTKYVVEGAGTYIRRWIELPNGKRISLPKRKVAKCRDRVSLVPDHVARSRSKIFA